MRPMTSNPANFTIDYAHCTKATAGELDTRPYTAYEMRNADLVLHSMPGYGHDGMDYWVTREATIIGDGDTAEDAIAQARYHLMHLSRLHAYRAAERALTSER